MLHFMSLALFILSTSIAGISADYCSYNGVLYYCSPGQTCGSYYGDCRGISTYVLVAIIFSSILLLSICLRLCIYTCNSNAQQARIRARNPRLTQVHVNGYNNNSPGRIPTAVPVHNIVEEAPPSYIAATSPNSGLPKY